jgi:ATP-dependent Clp protease protease subunit
MAAKAQLPPQTFLAFDKIDIELSKDICDWVLENNLSKTKHKFLTLMINSEGGDLSAAFAIIDIMRSSQIPVRTIATGEILSAGVMIFMAGEKGYRLMTPNTSIMSHRFSAGFDGAYHELKEAAKDHEMSNTKMINHYVTCTGLSTKLVEKHLLPHHDAYLTVEDAVKFGIGDVIAEIPFGNLTT